MAQDTNFVDLKQHAQEEANLRITGDGAAERTAFMVRRFCSATEVWVVPSRWAVLVPQDFEIDNGGEVELAADAILEILP